MKLRFLPILLLTLCVCMKPGSAQEKASSNNPTPAPSLFSTSGQGSSNAAVTNSAPVATPDQPVTNSPAAPAVPVAPADPLTPGPNSGAGSPGQNPPSSDPNALIPPPQEPESPSPINAAGNEEKQRLEQKAKYYEAKVKADKEEELATLLAKSDKAKNDESKREILRDYYDVLARRMKRIDPSISSWIDTMHAAYLRRLEQVRVEPSIPKELPPTAKPSASSSPSPSEKSSHRRKKNKKDGDESPAITSQTPAKKSAAEEKPSPSPKKNSKKNADSGND